MTTTRLTCRNCSAELPVAGRGRVPTYCSTRCRVAAHRSRRALPVEMTRLRRWVRRTSTKIPIQAVNGRPASSTYSATWSTYSQADRSSRGVGVGFVLAAGDGLVCIDLDHCLIGGELAPWARSVLDRCPPTFIEISVSGNGLHIFGLGELARGRRIRRAGANVEVYGSGRYIAVTGNRFENAPVRLADLSEVVASLA